MLDVAIVGGGPVGETLGALLGRANRSIGIYDRWPTLYALPRAGGIDHEAVRIWQSAGAIESVWPHLRPNLVYPWYGAQRQLLVDLWRDKLPPREVSGWNIGYQMYQPRLEDALNDVLVNLPDADVRRGWDVTSFSEEDDHIVLRMRELQIAASGELVPTGKTDEVRARYVVACDGANSAMREQAGLKLDDLGFESDWLVVDSEFTDQADRSRYSVGQYCEPQRPHMSTFLGLDHYRFEFMLMPGDERDELLKPETAYALMGDRIVPGDLRIMRQVIYTFRSMIGRQWRKGRLLFAGDAMHLMPPKLGQGLCSGVRDAKNLAWKLCDVLDGRAHDKLLDTYGEERIPHVEDFIHLSVYYAQLSCTTDPVEAAERDALFAAGKPPAAPPFPYLRSGLLDRRDEALHKVVGRLGPQGLVRYDGRTGLADDLVGQGWTLISRGDARLHLSEAACAILERSGVILLRLGEHDDAGFCVDIEGDYQRYFAGNDAHAVLVRPDFYVFGGVTDLDQLDALVHEYEAVMALYSPDQQQRILESSK